MVKKTIEERRSYVRAKHVLSIEYRLTKTKRKKFDKTWHLSTTQDMSAGGLSFQTEQEYFLGEILDLHVVMSGVLDIFKGQGEIVRVSKKKTGSYSLVGIKYLDKYHSKRPAKSYKQRPAAKKVTKKRSAKRV